jgi:anti-sigma regulatory factor (Ser/Thr protein kinase)
MVPRAVRPNPVVVRLPALPEGVSEARHRVADFAGGLGVRTADIEVAVTEAVANAVEHGFRGIQPGEIELRLELLVPDTLLVSVTDDGIGMSPDPDAHGLGLGLALIGRLSSGFEVRPNADHGTQVRMHFQLARG